jgi:hypothetical protein
VHLVIVTFGNGVQCRPDSVDEARRILAAAQDPHKVLYWIPSRLISALICGQQIAARPSRLYDENLQLGAS